MIILVVVDVSSYFTLDTFIQEHSKITDWFRLYQIAMLKCIRFTYLI